MPQHAVGALWRARRAVIVGDPLQLEPIFQVPGQVQDRLRDLFGVAGRWLPAGTSAQGMADRRNRWGTEIPVENRNGDTEKIWVGSPLRVHRRCEQPMFEISNTIAYQGLMVYGTIAKPFPGGPHRNYPRSSWVDVTGPAEGKWVAAQGDALLRILRRLRDGYDVSLGRIYVLSPFRDVVSQCRRLGRDQLGEYQWADKQIGTVHTMQGREADVVVLVFGTDPEPGEEGPRLGRPARQSPQRRGEPGAPPPVRHRRLRGMARRSQLPGGGPCPAAPSLACPWQRPSRIRHGWGVRRPAPARRLPHLIFERAGQGFGQHDGPGQHGAVEVAWFVLAQQLLTVGVPGEAALALEEPGEHCAGLGLAGKVAAYTEAAVSAVAADSRSRLVAATADRPALGFRCYPEGDRESYR